MSDTPGRTEPIVVTGAAGQVGRAVTQAARSRGLQVIPLARAELDVTDEGAVRDQLLPLEPAVVIHCAAWTDVDGAEAHPAAAREVNADGAGAVAGTCAEAGAHLLYLSTDYVFDGPVDRTGRPYAPDDEPHPLSVYARTKLEGERACRDASRWTVVRTSWVFGDPDRGFAAAVRRAAREGKPLTVVRDERSRPTWAPVLAEALLDLAEAEARGVQGVLGVHHAACRGEATRVELAEAILREAGAGGLAVQSVTAEEWGGAAERPHYSVLDLEKTEETLGRRFMDWRDAVKEWMR